MSSSDAPPHSPGQTDPLLLGLLEMLRKRDFYAGLLMIAFGLLMAIHGPTYSLGTSREFCEFAARHHIGLGVSFAPFEVVGKSTRYYREECSRWGWEPTPE